MSGKARDAHGRWRNKTIAFRMSPEENALLENFVRISGLTKQEYIIRRVLNKEIVVRGNPRVHKALRVNMAELCEVISNLPDAASISPETTAVLKMVATIYEGIKDEA